MVQQLKERLQKMEELEMQRIDDAKKIKEANTHPVNIVRHLTHFIICMFEDIGRNGCRSRV